MFVEGRPVEAGKEPTAHYNSVTADYFAAMSIPRRSGRLFTEREAWETGGVVVINESLERLLYPNGDSALGHRIAWGTNSAAVGPPAGGPTGKSKAR